MDFILLFVIHKVTRLDKPVNVYVGMNDSLL